MMRQDLDTRKSLIENSSVLAKAVQLAYDPSQQASTEWIADHPFVCGESQGRALVHKSKIGVLAIAGTNSLWDFSSNLQTRLTQVHGVYDLHTGFLKSAEITLAAFLSKWVGGECWETGEYYVCGHSLGAATAAVLPVLIDQQTKLSQPAGVIAFGSPHYVQGPSVMLWPCPVLHIQSRLDLVARIPNGLFGVRPWARAGQQVYVDDNGFDCYPGHEVTRLIGYVARVARLDFLMGKARSIQEHSMSLYAQRVQAGLARMEVLKERLENA